MTRPRKPASEPSKCRSCQADIYWIKWARSGKAMPVDSVPDMRDPDKGGGTVVVNLRGGEYGDLIAEKFDPAKHDAKRNRYTSHFATCPNANEHRKAEA